MGPLFVSEDRRKALLLAESPDKSESPPSLITQHEDMRVVTEKKLEHHTLHRSSSARSAAKKPVCCGKEALHANNNHNLRKFVVLLHDCIAIKFVKDDDTNCSGLTNEREGGAQQQKPSNPDHPMHGVHLYKAFLDENLKCHWNTGMVDAIRSLEYKGFIVPSTILVRASARYMNVLRTAWARRILRQPEGFTIELIGEVEEIVTQPVQQGQFAPLSDSLCWAILELTSTGQEAFVDSILSALHTAFPGMSHPPKELVFHTLEKLIREQKIYQTSHGYYIVTPDVSTFMNSRSATPAYMPLDAVLNYCDIDRISVSQHSWGSAASVLDTDEMLFRRRHSSSLKRHNSLRIIRQRDREIDMIPRPHMGARSLSFRLSKCNSLFDSDKEDDEEDEEDDDEDDDDDEDRELIATEQKQDTTQHEASNSTSTQTQPEKRKKRRSLFRRWFSFRRLLRPRSADPNHIAPRPPPNPPPQNPPPTTTQRTATTQTRDPIRARRWNSLPGSRQHQRNSILSDKSPFYDSLASPRVVHDMAQPPPHCSSWRRRHCSSTTVRTSSPCPSTSTSAIYASIASRESPLICCSALQPPHRQSVLLRHAMMRTGAQRPRSVYDLRQARNTAVQSDADIIKSKPDQMKDKVVGPAHSGDDESNRESSDVSH